MAEIKRPVRVTEAVVLGGDAYAIKDADGRTICLTLHRGPEAQDIASALNATLPPDLLKTALKVVRDSERTSVGWALLAERPDDRIGVDLCQKAGAELQARAREALRMVPEEAKADA